MFDVREIPQRHAGISSSPVDDGRARAHRISGFATRKRDQLLTGSVEQSSRSCEHADARLPVSERRAFGCAEWQRFGECHSPSSSSSSF